MKYSIKTINEIKENNFKFKKNFGQNFIIDENIINKIVEKSNITKKDTIVEIGPGIGSLTRKLKDVAKNVVCYEIDNSLQEYLSDIEDENCKIIYKDFLKADLEELKGFDNLKVIANLPYYITTPIITKIIESDINFSQMSLMMQKEVAERIVAKPGNKEYSSLTIFINCYYNTSILTKVSKNVFYPKPNVDSVVLNFTKLDEELNIVDKKHFFKLIRDAFTQKRKTIRNNLKNYDESIVQDVLKEHGFDINKSRSEMISKEIFIEISNRLVKNDRK